VTFADTTSEAIGCASFANSTDGTSESPTDEAKKVVPASFGNACPEMRQSNMIGVWSDRAVAASV